MFKRDDEEIYSVEFANQIKETYARSCGFVDLYEAIFQECLYLTYCNLLKIKGLEKTMMTREEWYFAKIQVNENIKFVLEEVLLKTIAIQMSNDKPSPEDTIRIMSLASKEALYRDQHYFLIGGHLGDQLINVLIGGKSLPSVLELEGSPPEEQTEDDNVINIFKYLN